MCNCGCHQKVAKPDTPELEKKIYICAQCNTFKGTEADVPAPECCGKKMQEMD